MNLDKLYIVKSTRKGVSEPIGVEILDMVESVAFRIKNDLKIPIDRYILGEVSPYAVDIMRGRSSSKDEGYGSGVGDTWSWTYFSSFSLEEANDYYKKELERIENTYKSNL